MTPRNDRWLPSISMWLVSLISYIDRNTLAILAPAILHEAHLSAEQYGFIISCFSVAYTVGNPVWGLILYRWGVRKRMNTAVGIWSVASVAHAWAAGFWSFGLARAVLGAGEGATFPGGLRTVTQTLSPAKRGRGLAIAYSGGSLIRMGGRIFRLGYVLDRAGPRFNALMLAALAFSLPLALMQSLPSGTLVLLDMFGFSGLVVLSIAWATRAFPPGNSGLLAGIGAGSWGAIVALMMPFFGRCRAANSGQCNMAS